MSFIAPFMVSLPASFDQWLEYISRQHSAEIVMGLDRVRAVWLRLGGAGTGPQAPLNIVVGGTNGKGSTCAMLQAILNCAGYKTGLYTSPHLLRYNERVRIAGQQASDGDLCRAFATVEAARQDIPLTYFEFATLSALWLFHNKNVEIAILEVGLGGRLDAVNIVDADVAVVTSVDLDHQAFLGETREAIGYEKAHIFRTGRPAIFGDTNPPQSLLDHAAAIGIDLVILDRDYRFQRSAHQWEFLGRHGAWHALPFPALRGAYQLKNASAALAALEALKGRLPVAMGHIKQGLLEVEWPGRLQILPGRPAVILDVAHNPHAARALEDALGSMGYYENTFAVFGMLKDKDIDSVIRIVKSRIDRWYVAGLPGERGATGALITEKLERQGIAGDAVQPCSTIAAAFDAACREAGQGDRILAFGSFLTVAGVLGTPD